MSEKKQKKSPAKQSKCGKCGKTIAGSVIEHLWKDHKAHMMKNRARGPRQPKAATAAAPVSSKLADAIRYEILGCALGKTTKIQAFDAIAKLVAS